MYKIVLGVAPEGTSAAARRDLKQWQLELHADSQNAKVIDDLIRLGGEPCASVLVNVNVSKNTNPEKKKWEGRKVGIDFFRGPKGPPDDLRKEKDEYPGRFGLASEYAGDRNLVNPWEWYRTLLIIIWQVQELL